MCRESAVGSKPMYPTVLFLERKLSVDGVMSWIIPLHFNSSTKFFIDIYLYKYYHAILLKTIYF